MLPAETRVAIGEAFATEAWHVYAGLLRDAVVWLQAKDAARISAANAATARILGERAD